MNTISKFEADVRAQVNIICHEENDNKLPHEEVSSNDSKKDSNDKNDANDNKSISELEEKRNLHKPSTEAPRELGEEMEAVANSHPTTVLYSHKMIGLKNLLLSEKLNTHAISLHLTAQSQVFVSKKQRPNSDSDPNVHCSIRPKRVRRE